MGFWSSLGTALGVVGGALVGGPAGAAIGGAIGGGFGGMGDASEASDDADDALAAQKDVVFAKTFKPMNVTPPPGMAPIRTAEVAAPQVGMYDDDILDELERRRGRGVA